jgi:hypothetical protein
LRDPGRASPSRLAATWTSSSGVRREMRAYGSSAAPKRGPARRSRPPLSLAARFQRVKLVASNDLLVSARSAADRPGEAQISNNNQPRNSRKRDPMADSASQKGTTVALALVVIVLALILIGRILAMYVGLPW